MVSYLFVYILWCFATKVTTLCSIFGVYWAEFATKINVVSTTQVDVYQNWSIILFSSDSPSIQSGTLCHFTHSLLELLNMKLILSTRGGYKMNYHHPPPCVSLPGSDQSTSAARLRLSEPRPAGWPGFIITYYARHVIKYALDPRLLS